jgi:DNA repair exonuclease SbcCD ATPase subunit
MQPDNHGRTLILVPADAAIEPRRSPERAAGVSAEQTEQFGRMLDLFEAADARVDRAERRAEQAEQRAERAEHGIEQAEQRATRAEERRTAAQGLADQALAQLTDATARADRLRDNLNSTYADLMTAERRAKEPENRARQAHAEAQVSLRAAEALRQADCRPAGEGPCGAATGGMAGRMSDDIRDRLDRIENKINAIGQTVGVIGAIVRLAAAIVAAYHVANLITGDYGNGHVASLVSAVAFCVTLLGAYWVIGGMFHE